MTMPLSSLDLAGMSFAVSGKTITEIVGQGLPAPVVRRGWMEDSLVNNPG